MRLHPCYKVADSKHWHLVQKSQTLQLEIVSNVQRIYFPTINTRSKLNTPTFRIDHFADNNRWKQSLIASALVINYKHKILRCIVNML